MENSVGSTIEKIKLQELNTEAKLKEKRELEATIASLNRRIRDATTFVEKSRKDQADLGESIDKLRGQVQLERIKRDALLSQVDVSGKELEELKRLSEKGISDVWNTRSTLCNAIQKVSDDYDIWAMLMKPVPAEPLHVEAPDNKDQNLESDSRLRKALKRREDAIQERDRLLNEPDSSEEFIRIKNALKYSLEKVVDLQNNYS